MSESESPTPLTLSDFQRRVLAIPEMFDVFLGGGRGGGKSWALALLALRHAEQYGAKARILYVRQSYKGCADFEGICREVFGLAYPRGLAFYNASEHVWRLGSGAYFELAQLQDARDYSKFQGRSFSLLLVDECAQYPSPEMLDKLRSNLRGPRGVPIRTVMAANPGDPGHGWVASRYVFGHGAPWQPFDEAKSGRRWVHAPSTYLANEHIDRDEYRRQLEASCPADPELLAAWVRGDWACARGAYFGAVLSEARTAIEPWEPSAWPQDARRDWEVYLAHDYGVRAPSVTYVCARSRGATGPDARWYPAESVCLLDELATHVPGFLDRGMECTIPVLAEEIKALAKRWNMRPVGCADDSIFAKGGHLAGSIADEFRRYGVGFHPAGKGDRRSGWEKLRKLMEAAGSPDRGGLYVARSCGYWWDSVPFLGRDPRRPDDVDTRGVDHAADATRYAVVYQPPRGPRSLYGPGGLMSKLAAQPTTFAGGPGTRASSSQRP